MKTSAVSFVLPPPRRVGRELSAIACIAACVIAAVITLVPAAGDRWSHATYPAIASWDRTLAPYGVAIGPQSLEIPVNSESTTPLIDSKNVIVFGNIQPDETVVELSLKDRLGLTSDMQEVSSLKDVTRPVHWQRIARPAPPSSEPHPDRQ